MFCLDARSRFRDTDAGGATSGVVLRERTIRPRNSSWLYNHAVETPASAATVRKLISRSEASIRCRAAKARCIALLLRSRALRLRPSVFLGMCSLQRCDDIDEVVSFPLIHFDLTCPSIRAGFGNHSFRIAQLRPMHIKEAGVRAEVSAI